MGEVIQPGKLGRETLVFAARGRRGIQEESDAINLIREPLWRQRDWCDFPRPLVGLTACSPAFGRKRRGPYGMRLDRIIKSIELNSLILRHLLRLRITGLLLAPNLAPM